MLEQRLKPVPALAGIADAGRHGRREQAPGLRIQPLDGLQIVSLAARRGQSGSLAAAIAQRWHLDLPRTPRVAKGPAVAVIWSGSDQWLVIAEDRSFALEAELRALAQSMASISAQGSGRVVLRLSGPAVREVLSGVVPIDLHPRAFRPGDTALTLAGHVGVQLWQIDEAPCFELIAARSYAASLWHSVIEAGLTVGVEVLPIG